MRNNLKVASIFAALVVLWLASGLFSEPEAPVPNLVDAMASMSDLSLPSVVIEEIRSEPKRGGGYFEVKRLVNRRLVSVPKSRVSSCHDR